MLNGFFATRPKIFISYANEDAEKVKAYIKPLEAAGCTVWWDGSLRGGENWSDEINVQLQEADVVLIFWSVHSVLSPWVRIEANHAQRHDCLLPIRLDGVELPDEYRLIQTLDASAGLDVIFDRLVHSVSNIFRTTKRRKYLKVLGGTTILFVIAYTLLVLVPSYDKADKDDTLASLDPKIDKSGLDGSPIQIWREINNAVTESDLQNLAPRIKFDNASNRSAALCVIYLRQYQLSRRESDLTVAGSHCDNIDTSLYTADGAEALAWYDYHRGNHEKALLKFDESLERSSERLGSLLGKAESLDGLQNAEEAETAFTVASVFHPGSWRIQNAMATFFLSQGRLQESIKRYELAADISPDNISILNNLGVSNLFNQNYAAAVMAWNKALDIMPVQERGATLVNIGSAYYLMRDFNSAKLAFRKATRIAGDDYRVWGNLADSLMGVQDVKAATVAYRRALDRAMILQENTDGDAQLLASIASFKAVLDEEGAEALLEQATALAKDNPEVQRLVSLTFIRLGNYIKAEQAYGTALMLGYPQFLLDSDYLFDSLKSDR